MQPTDDAPAPPRRTFFRRPRMLIALGVAVGLLVFHQSLLGAAFGLMVVDQPSVDCRLAVVVTATPECYDTAAAMVREKTIDTVLVVESKPVRSIRIGAMPKPRDIAMKELTQRGVAADRIRVIQTQAETGHQMFRELDQAISDQTPQRVSVISTSTLSRYHRKVIDQALPADRWSSYPVRSVTHKNTSPDQWWHRRSSVREVLNHGLRLAFVTCRGESETDSHDPYEHLFSAPTVGASSNGE